MGIGQWLLIAGYFLAFVCILIGYTWTIVLYCLGGSYLREMRAAPAGDEADYLWVFLVPALNEGVTIADSVARLRAVQATHKVILVINDGSEDDTAEVLDRIAGPDLEVFTRTAPNARQGKAVALNAAFRHVQDEVLSRPGMGRWDPAKVIVGIVDADGRLADSAPALVARHFDKPRVGGVQVGVAIYNVESYLTRMQSLEFQIFGGLFQVGRSRWGAAFMGGNGQFNRMSALSSVASAEGPWSRVLDGGPGTRTAATATRLFGEQEPLTHVAQQGVNSLGPLYRQRTRWMQGNLEVFADFRRLHSHHLVGLRRMDALVTLLQPAMQIIVGVAVIAAVVLSVVFGVPYLPLDNFWLTLFFIQLSFGPTFLGVLVVARGRGPAGVLRALAVAVPYILYTWIMWPVVFKGLWARMRGNTVWSKTAREAIKPVDAGAGAAT